MITIIVIIGLKLFMIIVWITAHFGKNPINGGRPPSDNKVVNRINLVVVFLAVDIVWLINEMLYNLAAAVTAAVRREYTVKYITHRFLPPIRAINIQPVWLMDEYVKIFRSDV